VLSGAKFGSAVLDGVDMTDAVTDAPAGKPLSEVGMAPEELLRLHALWADTGGAQGQVADLTGVDCRSLPSLRGKVLVGLRAERATLVGLDLSGCQLQGARLAGADLRDCKFAGADLRGVNLAGAKLTRADLRDCDFTPLVPIPGRSFPSNLSGTVFRAADLRGAKFGNTPMPQADLRDVLIDDTQIMSIDFADVTLDARLKKKITPAA